MKKALLLILVLSLAGLCGFIAAGGIGMFLDARRDIERKKAAERFEASYDHTIETINNAADALRKLCDR